MTTLGIALPNADSHLPYQQLRRELGERKEQAESSKVMQLATCICNKTVTKSHSLIYRGKAVYVSLRRLPVFVPHVWHLWGFR